jgi:hypothetical protein
VALRAGPETRAYTYELPGARPVLGVAAVTGALFVGAFLGVALHSEAATLVCSVTAGATAIAGTRALRARPVTWYRVREGADGVTLVSASGEETSAAHAKQAWELPHGLTALLLAGAAAVGAVQHDPLWPVLGTIGLIAAVDAWLFPRGLRPVRTFRARLGGVPRLVHVVAAGREP